MLFNIWKEWSSILFNVRKEWSSLLFNLRKDWRSMLSYARKGCGVIMLNYRGYGVYYQFSSILMILSR